MSFAWVGALTAVASVGMGAYSLATQPGMPGTPDVAGASRGAVEAESEMLPLRRQLEAAARQGGKVTIQNYPAHTKEEEFYWVKGGSHYDFDAKRNIQGLATMGVDPVAGTIMATLGSNKKRTVWNQVSASEWEPGGKFEGKDLPPWGGGTRTVNVPEGPKEFDFTGYGEADVQSKLARDQAQLILDLNEKYGSQFIEESLKQEALADPEGTAARKKLYELIQQQAGEDPERPVADLLDSQVKEQLAAGNGLDRVSEDVLNEAIRQAGTARGESYGADFSEPLTTGFEGQARLDAGQQKALGWLTSGATPEDVEYRRSQQTMANLSDFTNNRTPQSQFASLSGAQNGAAPVVTGPPGPQNSGSSAGAAANAATQTWNSQLQQQGNQADPWMAGLSLLLDGASVVAKAR